MSWNVTLFKNTNLTTVNVIQDPAILNKIAQTDVRADIYIISPQDLTSITIKATFDDVENVDYVRISDANHVYYYTVEGPAHPDDTNTWTLPIAIDAWLTGLEKIGGYSNLEILDGICERHHVTAGDDKFGAYTEPDPYMTPSKELRIAGVAIFNSPVEVEKHIIESTVDLSSAGTGLNATEYEDPNTGAKCTIPTPAKSVNQNTAIGSSFNNAWTRTTNSAYFDFDEARIKAGLDKVRALGQDQGTVLASVVIPENMIAKIDKDENGVITYIKGKQTAAPVKDLPYEYAEVHNKRLLYGETSAITLYSTASGQSVKFNPEELYVEGAKYPILYQDVYAAANGSPIYRFKYFRNVDVIENNMFQNAVYGMEWKQAPLVYTGQSGSALTEIRYNAQQNINKMGLNQLNEQLDFQRAQQIRGIGVGALKNIGQQAIAGFGTGGIGGAIGGAISGAIGSGIQGAYDLWEGDQARQLQRSQALQRYQMNANKELMDLKIATAYVAPELHFPRSITMRDLLGNGVYVIQYRPDKSDLQKMDKILTMYGYKDTKVLNKADFNKRAKFSYVKASGVQIGGNMPKWLRELMAAQISAGIRVWKVKPDPTVYTDGSNT